jgi:Zn-dependent protease with chaperone function
MNRKSSLAGRAVLAVALMVGFYLLALGLCALAGVLIYADLQSSRIHVKLWAFALLTIGVIPYSLWPRRLRFDDPGVELARKDQPRLWAVVDEIAKAAAQEPPRKLFLVGEINAFVAERNSRMGFGGERILGIGLPLMQVLSVQQLRSVIAHEFGHYHGGDTRLGPFVYRTRDAIGRTVATFRNVDSLLHLPFHWYGKLYLRVTFAISRAQEFAADALSVQLVGVEPARTALRRINEVAPLFDSYLRGEYLPLLNQDCRPPLAEGFSLFLSSQAARKAQVELGEQAMQAKGNPYDTHPPLSERLKALEQVERAHRGRVDTTAAITLLVELDGLERELLAFLTNSEDIRKLPALSWKESASKYRAHWARFVASTGTEFPAATLRELPTLVARLDELGKLVNPELKREERRSAAIWALGVLVAHALARAGFAIETGPGDPVELVRGAHRIDPFVRVRDLCEGRASESDWHQLCDELALGELALSGPALAAT